MKNFNLKVKQLDYLYDNLLNGIIGIFILTSIVLFTYYDLVLSLNLAIWFSLNMTIMLFRFLSLRSYKNVTITDKNYTKYYLIFFILSSLNAALWGSMAFYLIPSDFQYKTMLLIFVFGLVSSAAVSLSSRFEVFFTYLTLALSPFIYTLIQNSHNSDKVLSFAVLLFTLILIIQSKKVSNHISENIQTAYLNQNLVLQLQDKVQEAKSASKAKSEFLSIMSHEIRTPLNAIMGFVQILKKSEKDTKKYKYLDTIDKSSKSLTNIINDILDISKIESGKFTLEMSKFSPKDEFTSLFNLFEQNAIENKINLINSISSELPYYLKSDILRIKQIVSNLLSNAIKFTGVGKNIELIVTFNQTTSSLYIEVKDEGIGISQENIQNVTKAFTQADSSTARKYGGTGLGLSIVTNLLQLFKTELRIQSILGEGSSFNFNLKVKQIKGIPSIQQETQNINFNAKKILVAEDNKTNQMLINIILTEMNMKVTIVQNGKEAIETFKKEYFDLVLMDINMPIMNGSESMLEIKKYQKEHSRETPIIALTANAVSGDKQKYLNAGFDGYLSKPIETEKLIEVLNSNFSK